ncbi:hypothetical protein KKG48_01255 [Patescibacteria group bacterium]|nr:hypothetical protein [Patescibacteria group bacterium]
MKNKQKNSLLTENLIIGVIGIIFLLFVINFMCKQSSEFCSFGYKIFAVILVIVFLSIRQFYNRKN